MKLKLLAWSLCLACSAAQAQVVDLGEVSLQQPVLSMAQDYAPVALRDDYVGLSFEMSHLPEPAVFLMMLTGLILLGGIARRERSDVFREEEE
jgi:hypothetical protein